MADIIPLDPYGAFLGNEKTQQEIARSKALTDAQVLDTAMKGDLWQRDQAFRAEAAKLATPNPFVPTTGKAGTDYPDASAESGFSVPKAPPQEDAVTALMRQATLADSLVNLAVKMGAPGDTINKQQDNAKNAWAAVSNAQKDKLAADKDRWTNIGRVAQLISDPATFQAGIAEGTRLAAASGQPIEWDKIGLQPNLDGSFSWDPKVGANAAKVAAYSMEQKDLLHAQQQAADLIERGRHNKELEKEAEKRAQLEQQRISIERDNLKERQNENKERRKERQMRDAETVTNRVQNTLNSAEPYKNFDRYSQAAHLSNSIAADMEKDKSYDVLTGPRAETLKQAFVQTTHAFRSRDPGRWADKAVQDSANGALQKMEKWAATLGTATPSISRTGAKEIIKSINELHTFAMAESFAEEAAAVKAAIARGGNPDGLALKAYTTENLRKLIGAGVVKPTYREGTKNIESFTIGGRTFTAADLTPKDD